MWFLVLKLLVVYSLTKANSEQACRRFQTLEVLQRYRWSRTILPWTEKDAKENGWNRVSSVNEYSLEMYRFKQVNNFFIFFYKGNLVGVGPTFKSDAGTQMVISRQQHKDNIRRMGLPKALKLRISSKIENWLDDMGNILKRKSSDPCTENVIFFEDKVRGNWYQTPMFESEIPTRNKYMDKQGCLDRFGYHYFYSLKDSTRCKQVHGFFSFYDDYGVLSGFGALYEDSEILWEDKNHPHPVYRFLNIQEVKDLVPNNKKCITRKPYEGYTAIYIFIKSMVATHDFKCIKLKTDP